MIRAVVDPGVLIAGLISPAGAPSMILQAWQRGIFDLIVCPMLLDELTTVLLRPKFRRWVRTNDAVVFVETLRLAAVTVDDPVDVPRVSRDPHDDHLFALATTSAADVLVSGDGDITSVGSASVRIETPRRFLTIIDALG